MIKVVDRGQYGWVEFVAHRGGDTRESVQRFYWRLGSLLAILYALQAVDFHYENLIADGEHPVLVDPESLFHSRPSGSERSAHARALQRLQRSVWSVGLLPVVQWSRDMKRRSDVGGTGGRRMTFAQPCPG